MPVCCMFSFSHSLSSLSGGTGSRLPSCQLLQSLLLAGLEGVGYGQEGQEVRQSDRDRYRKVSFLGLELDGSKVERLATGAADMKAVVLEAVAGEKGNKPGEPQG